MKRFTTVFFVSVVLLMSFSSSALAKSTELPKPGITPDSPLYALKGFFEGLQLFFKLDPADKAETASHLADVKISELAAMSRDGKPAAAEKALKKYKKYMALAEKNLEKAPGDVSRVEALRLHVATMTAKHLSVLTALLDKVPDSAKAAIRHAIEASSHGHGNAPRHAGGGVDDEVSGDAVAGTSEDALAGHGKARQAVRKQKKKSHGRAGMDDPSHKMSPEHSMSGDTHGKSGDNHGKAHDVPGSAGDDRGRGQSNRDDRN